MEITDFHKDAICEAMNIGAGQAGAVMSELVNKNIAIAIPQVEFIEISTVRNYLDEHFTDWKSCINLSLSSGIKGEAILIFSEQSAKGWFEAIALAQFGSLEMLTPEMETDLLIEVGNILINNSVGGLANLINITVDYAIPKHFSKVSGEIFESLLDNDRSGHLGMIMTTNLKIEGEEIETDLMLTLSRESLNEIFKKLESLV